MQADAVLTINGSITGNGAIIKTGLQTASLTASNSYTGNTIVNAGELDLEQPTLAANSTVIITNNATLNLDFSVTNIVAALVLNGTNQPVGVYDANSGAPFITGSGALQVVYTAPPVLSVANLGGNQLQFSWTGSGTLQSQTNSLTTGLGSNWVNYPGSSPVTITVDPTQGSVFFRVKQ